MRPSRLLLGLTLLVTVGCRAEPLEPTPAPDFSLPGLDGSQVSLAELRGRPVVIDFWATWCAPCIYQIPVLNAFYEDHRDTDVVVLGVSVDAGGSDAVAQFAEEQRIAYPVLLGDEALAQRYGARGYPSLYVVAPDGTIDSAHVGVVSKAELEEAVEAARSR